MIKADSECQELMRENKELTISILAFIALIVVATIIVATYFQRHKKRFRSKCRSIPVHPDEKDSHMNLDPSNLKHDAENKH